MMTHASFFPKYPKMDVVGRGRGQAIKLYVGAMDHGIMTVMISGDDFL